MARYSLFILATLLASCRSYIITTSSAFEFVSRDEWNARPSGPVTMLENPASHVVIHHTYQPGVCLTLEACKTVMRNIQAYHQDTNGWEDIGFNFAIGGEGRVYEGSGWNVVGAHTYGYNSRSVGIVFIGDWRTELPPAVALQAAKDLIAEGMQLGYISTRYVLMGHNQATATECPGEALFSEISTWPHFRLTPSLEFVPRDEWEARPSTSVTRLANPASHVVIHHTHQPGVCMSLSDCKSSMRTMQNYDLDINGWSDIGYNFAIGGEGRVYEGRGWGVVGAHTSGYDSMSVGIAFIGDWSTELPPAAALQAAKDWIREGVRQGYISPNYILMSHKQVSVSEFPEDALFGEISTWPNFQQVPFKFYTRLDWEATAANNTQPLDTPVPYVVIHHTELPAACFTIDDCARSMRSMQRYHAVDLGWGDIGFSFCVGSEGGVYEGRGWETMGRHASGANAVSLGICLIGDWRNELPPQVQLDTTKALINFGVYHGFIDSDLKIVGHNQVTASECPGEALFEHISTWDHFSDTFVLPN